VVGAAYGGTALLRRLSAPELVFEPIPGLPGFRRVAGGAVSTGAAPFLGLDGSSAPQTELPDICSALFSADRTAGDVPIAYFSDPRCVNCRTVSPIVADLGQEPGIHVTWHEWPILGQMSQRAARAALAARAQGAYAVFHDRLMGATLLPTDSYLTRLAQEAGIDPDRLLDDMTGPAVDRQLAQTAALARRLGFAGTPALVIGRTAVMGRMDRRELTRLIDAERGGMARSPCAVVR
jgi:protein-disulfide isomerase